MKRFVVLVAGLVLLAGCVRFGGGNPPVESEPPASPTTSPAPSDEATSHPSGSDQLVLRLEQTGGFVPVEWTRTNIPSLSVYGDGTVITVAPTTLEYPGRALGYPGRALPNLQVSQISEEYLDELLAAADEAGLTQGERDLPLEPMTIADAATTVLTVVTDQLHRTSAYALMEASEEDNAERSAMREFIATHLNQLTPNAIGPYHFVALRVWTSPAREGQMNEPDDELASEADWPLQADLADFGEPSTFGAADESVLRCGVVTGDELTELRRVVDEEANALTKWRSGGELYSVQFRPLLPDEEGCLEVVA